MNNKKGFTIVELLIFMGILSILLVILTEMFGSVLDLKLESESLSHVEQDGRYIISKYHYDVEQASAILQPVNIGSTSTTLQLRINGIDHLYNIQGNNLTLLNNQGSNALNGYLTHISNLMFKKIGNISGKETVQITFTVQSTINQKKGVEIKNFQATAGLR